MSNLFAFVMEQADAALGRAYPKMRTDPEAAWDALEDNRKYLELAGVLLDQSLQTLEQAMEAMEEIMIENPLVTGEADFLPFEPEMTCPKCEGGMAEGDKTYEVDGELMCDQCFDDWRRGLSRDELAERLGVEVRYV